MACGRQPSLFEVHTISALIRLSNHLHLVCKSLKGSLPNRHAQTAPEPGLLWACGGRCFVFKGYCSSVNSPFTILHQHHVKIASCQRPA